ncbi:hypothetical protein WR25_12885 isoform A [Diploscapter pachys]|uniref:BTB domain-containing protein n=1 Tax=Diploscapter pachys TaxID=2018661 RepID=A0A2A2LUY7_9BILA|nr:hypothetical protein WR25_12885 isoform A [Diploscapter pachys]
MDKGVVVTRCGYNDFAQPTAWRNFELIVENKHFFVNPGWLAELSSFFQDYCFGEDTAGSALIVDDISSAEMLEFLRCIFFCPTRKPLSIANIPLVLRVATRFEMKPVLARCEVFIANTVNTLDRNKLLQITTAVSQYDPNSSNLTVLIDRLASIREDELNPTQFSEMPGDVVADIYRHRMRTREKKRKEFGCVMGILNSLRSRIRSGDRT